MPERPRRRGHQEGSIRQRPDGRWEARVRLPDGSRPSFYGKTRAEVQTRLRSALRDVEQGLSHRAGTQTVAAFLDEWLDTVIAARCRPATVASYREHAQRYIVPLLGHRPIAKLTPRDAQAAFTALLNRGLAPETVNLARRILRSALTTALRWGLVTRNVVMLTDPARASTQPRHAPLTASEATRFLEAVRGDRLEAMYLTAISLGLRPSEVRGLRWSDVDLDAGALHVRWSVQRTGDTWAFTELKTKGSARTLPLPAFLVAALRAHRPRQLEVRLAAGGRWQEWGLLFPSMKGTPQEQEDVRRRFQRVLQRAGLPSKRFYDLRHSCGTFLYANGVSPRTIMEILGHAQISTTMNTYVHGVNELNREALETLGRTFGKSASSGG